MDEMELRELVGQVGINGRLGRVRPQAHTMKPYQVETVRNISHYALAGWELRCEPVVDSAGRTPNSVREGQTECAITAGPC